MKTVPRILDTTSLHAILHQAELRPTKLAVQSGSTSVTYEELVSLLDSFGRYLNRKNIKGTDRVVVMLPQGIQMAMVSLGVLRNAICVPINPDFTSNELDQLIEMIDPQLILTDKIHCETFGRCKKMREGVGLVHVEIDATSKSWRFDGSDVEKENPAQVQPLPTSDDTALLLLTSGSTSTPKLVPLSHKNIAVSGRNLVRSLNLTENDRCLNTMTMFHVGGLLDLLLTPLSVGGSVYIPERIGSKAFFENLSEFDPTWYQAVPTMLLDIVNYAEMKDYSTSDSSLRLIRAVSSPLSADLASKLEDFFHVPVIEIYGMTETAGVIASNPLPPEERKPLSVGKVVGETELRIIDGQNNPVATNSIGEIIVSGDAVFEGYDQNGERNRDHFIGNWFKTGDTGLIDNDGYLFLKGRVKDIINRGGEKIAPLEIDWVIQAFPGVAEAAAFGTDHPSLGEEVAAAIVPASEGEIDEQKLRDHLARHLAQFKRPRNLVYLNQLPRNSGGKIQRHLLKGHLNGEKQHADTVSDLPESELEKLIAQLWKKALGVKRVGIHDDFFELGGDSLRATLFIAQLEEKIKHSIDAKLIYEFPELKDFALQLKAKPWFKSNKKRGQEGALREELKRLMALWPGKRLNEDSLIVGHNVIGSKTPIFWCTNSLDHFVEQIKHFDADQPIYGMVSLMESKFRSIENNARAAEIYSEEILNLSQGKELIIGAWCEGAKIMIDTANQLQQRGIEVKLLFMQDNFIPKPYNKPVAFFFSNYAMNRFRNQYHNPDLGITKYYTDGFSTQYDDIEHTAYYQDSDTMKRFVAGLNRRIETIEEIGAETGGKSEMDNPQLLSPEDYKAKIVVDAPPLFMKRGVEEKVVIEITNKSNTTWQPGETSAITLMITWLDFKYSQLAMEGVLLPQKLAPEQSVILSLKVKPPQLEGSSKVLFLQIDLVDDGVARFASHTSKAVRFPTLSAPLMLWPVLMTRRKKNLMWIEKALWYKRLRARSLPILATNSTIKVIRKIRDITYKYTN